MARKPRDYAAEYARRVRGTAKGSAARQRARGKQTGEHRERVRREKEKYGLVQSERAQIREFIREQAKRAGRDPDQEIAAAYNRFRDNFRLFKEVRVRRDEFVRRPRPHRRPPVRATRGGAVRVQFDLDRRVTTESEFEDWADDHELPDWYLFYH